MSQEELALSIGTNQRQISMYENDKNSPTGEVLIAMADVLDTTVDYLLGRSDITDRPLRGMFDLDDIEREAIKVLRSKPREQRPKIVEIMRMV